MRKLEEDLEICNNATKAPWRYGSGKFGNMEVYSPTERGFHNNGGEIADLDYYDNVEKDAKFITEAREGWPEAIQRAIKAEEQLKNIRLSMSDDYGDDPVELIKYLKNENKQLRDKVTELEADIFFMENGSL